MFNFSLSLDEKGIIGPGSDYLFQSIKTADISDNIRTQGQFIYFFESKDMKLIYDSLQSLLINNPRGTYLYHM